MAQLMRCQYCGLLQDEPQGAKSCSRCGGELAYEGQPPTGRAASYVQVQMELDQVNAPSGQNVERFLLITIRTPDPIPPEEAAAATGARAPLGLTAILDVSGSMQGEKLLHAQDALRQALSRLHDGDVVSLVTFADEPRCLLEPTLVDQRIRGTLESALQEMQAGGMTALCGGLELGLEKASNVRQDAHLALLLSDGQANVGETDLEIIGKRASQGRQNGVIVSTLGVGLDYIEALMAEIATQGGGRFYHILDPGQIPAYLAGELGEVADLAARETKIHLAIPEGATLVPLSAAYPVQQGAGQAVVSAGDIPRATELEIPLRLALISRDAGTRLSIEGSLTYRSPAGNDFEAPINRVSVRFLEGKRFAPRQGVVAPVVEHVLTQMKAAGVLHLSRAMAHKPEEADEETVRWVNALRALPLSSEKSGPRPRAGRSQSMRPPCASIVPGRSDPWPRRTSPCAAPRISINAGLDHGP